MKLGDAVWIRGVVDEIRKDTVIIKNKGGYFGTDPCEVVDAPRWGEQVRYNCPFYAK